MKKQTYRQAVTYFKVTQWQSRDFWSAINAHSTLAFLGYSLHADVLWGEGVTPGDMVLAEAGQQALFRGLRLSAAPRKKHTHVCTHMNPQGLASALGPALQSPRDIRRGYRAPHQRPRRLGRPRTFQGSHLNPSPVLNLLHFCIPGCLRGQNSPLFPPLVLETGGIVLPQWTVNSQSLFQR